VWTIVGNIVSAPVTVAITVVPVVMIVPVIVVSVIIVPVVGPPWTPVRGIVAIIPVGPPNRIPGVIDIPDDWPGCDIIVGGGDHFYISPVGLPGISRIGCFSIDWFNNIIWPVQRLVTD